MSLQAAAVLVGGGLAAVAVGWPNWMAQLDGSLYSGQNDTLGRTLKTMHPQFGGLHEINIYRNHLGEMV